MFERLKEILESETFITFFNIVMAETIITATFIFFNQVPSEEILSSNLMEIILIFEA